MHGFFVVVIRFHGKNPHETIGQLIFGGRVLHLTTTTDPYNKARRDTEVPVYVFALYIIYIYITQMK